EGEDRDFGEIDLLAARQGQQQVERAFPAVEIERQPVGLGRRRLKLEILIGIAHRREPRTSAPRSRSPMRTFPQGIGTTEGRMKRMRTTSGLSIRAGSARSG